MPEAWTLTVQTNGIRPAFNPLNINMSEVFQATILEMSKKERLLQELQVAYQAKTAVTESWKKKSEELEVTHSQQIQVNQRQGKEIEWLKVNNKVVVDNLLLAQKQLQMMSTQSPLEDHTELDKENQKLKEENENMKK